MKSFSDKFVLVVDDDEVQRIIMVGLLMKLGVRHVTVVASVNEALAHLREHLVHVVFTDYEMPERDGLQLAGEIALGRTLRHIPVVMVTTVDTKDLHTRLRQYRGRHIQKLGLTSDHLLHVLQELFPD